MENQLKTLLKYISPLHRERSLWEGNIIKIKTSTN